jgi:hypothetical protein
LEQFPQSQRTRWPMIQILTLTLITFAAYAQSQGPTQQLRLNVAQALLQSDLAKTGQAQVLLCFTNADFRANVDLTLIRTTDRLKMTDPEAVIDSGHELCVDSSKVVHSLNELDELRQRMGSVDTVQLEVIKPVIPPAEKVKMKSQEPSLGRQVILTLRAAATGAAGALLIQKTRPALDYFSNKGQGDVSLPAGAAIGIITDTIQRLAGETDESKIAQRNFGASLIGSMVQTRDPNVVGLAVVLTLSQVPAIQNAIQALADSTPQKLNLVYPAMMIGAFALLGHDRRDEQWKVNKDKSLGALTFGSLAAVVTARYKGHETAGFIVATTASLLDELCDAATNRCKGRFSLADLTANTIGAVLGVKLGGLVFSKTQGGIKLHYYREM